VEEVNPGASGTAQGRGSEGARKIRKEQEAKRQVMTRKGDGAPGAPQGGCGGGESWRVRNCAGRRVRGSQGQRGGNRTNRKEQEGTRKEQETLETSIGT